MSTAPDLSDPCSECGDRCLDHATDCDGYCDACLRRASDAATAWRFAIEEDPALRKWREVCDQAWNRETWRA
jgi:hypothetical protein